MLDSRVAFLAVVHADTKEAVVFPVHHSTQGFVAPFTMCLGGLDNAYRRVRKVAGKGAQPIGFYQVISINNGNPLRSRIGFFQGKIECSRLVAWPLGEMKKAQCLASAAADPCLNVILNWHPKRWVAGVVVDNHDFKCLPVQCQQAVDGGNHHCRRLIATG